MAETTDSVSRKKDSVSKLLSLGSDMSLGRGDERERELPLLVTADGTLGSRRRGRWLVGRSGGGGLGWDGGFDKPTWPIRRWAKGASCCWATWAAHSRIHWGVERLSNEVSPWPLMAVDPSEEIGAVGVCGIRPKMRSISRRDWSSSGDALSLPIV